MTTPEQKQRLEDKIREGVPESMELKFGCKVTDGVSGYIVNFVDPNCVHFCLGNAEELGIVRREWQILGRPLALQDVLIALPDNLVQVHLSNPIVLIVDIYNKKEAQYDLTKDYHHQSEEFYEFLYQLLI